MSKRSHREDCAKLEKDLKGIMRDDENKEVDFGAVNTKTICCLYTLTRIWSV